MTEKILDDDPDYNETLWAKAHDAWLRVSRLVGFQSREVAFKAGYSAAIKDQNEIMRSFFEAGFKAAQRNDL